RQHTTVERVWIRRCTLLIPQIAEVLADVSGPLQLMQGRSSLGHVELVGGLHPGLIVRHLQPLSEADQHRLLELAGRHGLACYLQSGSEAVLHCLSGDGAQPAYRLDDQQLTFHFAAGDFTQVNASINQQMVNQALDWLDVRPGERVLDLFCGVGNFTLPLARAGALVTGVEGSAEMVERAAANARLNGLESVHFFQADLSNSLDSAWSQQEFDAALLDPPRDGAAQMAGMLAQKRVQRILYVSCNPATLARDAGTLSAAGYRLVQAGIMDMFPQTAPVEAMALFVSG